LFLCVNSNSTNVSVSLSAKSLLTDGTGLFEPLTSPNNAKDIESNIVVFPAPVSPVIKNIPLSPSISKSISIQFLYGPNALIFIFNGFINSPLLLL